MTNFEEKLTNLRANLEAEKQAFKQERWAKISLNNIAHAGIFSADRSIKEYADNIWDLKPLKV